LKYFNVLVDEAVNNGLEIYEHMTATDIEYNKHPNIVNRDEHRINCNYVIQASHHQYYDVQCLYQTRMYLERAYITDRKTPEQFPGGMYINAESPSRSVRLANMDGEDLWLIVGENHKTGQGKSTMKHYEALQQFAEKQFGISEFVYRWSA